MFLQVKQVGEKIRKLNTLNHIRAASPTFSCSTFQWHFGIKSMNPKTGNEACINYHFFLNWRLQVSGASARCHWVKLVDTMDKLQGLKQCFTYKKIFGRFSQWFTLHTVVWKTENPHGTTNLPVRQQLKLLHHKVAFQRKKERKEKNLI